MPSPTTAREQEQQPQAVMPEDGSAAPGSPAGQRPLHSPLAPKFAKKARKRAAPSQDVARVAAAPADVVQGVKRARSATPLQRVTSDPAHVCNAAAKPASALQKLPSDVIDTPGEPAQPTTALRRLISDARARSGTPAAPKGAVLKMVTSGGTDPLRSQAQPTGIVGVSAASTAPANLALASPGEGPTKTKKQKRKARPADQAPGSAVAAGTVASPGLEAPLSGLADHTPVVDKASTPAADQHGQPASSGKSILARASKAQRNTRTALAKQNADSPGSTAQAVQPNASCKQTDATPARPGRPVAPMIGGLAGVLPVLQHKPAEEAARVGQGKSAPSFVLSKRPQAGWTAQDRVRGCRGLDHVDAFTHRYASIVAAVKPACS